MKLKFNPLTGNFDVVEAGGEASGTAILKTSDFTAEEGKKYAVDTTDGSINVTLPLAPGEGKEVCFVDARGTWNTYPPTFLRNGKKIEAHDIDFTDSAQGTFFCALFIDDTTGWRILESGTKPQILVNPEITGHYVGGVISSTTGTWTGTPTSFAYQWQVSDDGVAWANIEGASGSSFTPDSPMEGKYVRVLVTASNSNGASLPAESNTSDQLETPPFPAGAIGFWKLSDLTDASGNGNTLTNSNGVTFDAGKLGNAAVFDGSEGQALTAPIPALTDFTLVGWFKIANPLTKITSWWGGYECTVVTLAGEDGMPGLWLVYMSEGAAGQDSEGGGDRLRANWDASSTQVFAGSADGDGAWHFFAVRASGGTVEVFVDSASVHADFSGSGISAGEIQIGNTLFTTGQTMEGSIDGVGLWPRALSDFELAQLLNAGAGLEPA